MPFDLAKLISECEAAFDGEEPQNKIIDVLTKSLCDPASVKAVLAPTRRTGFEKLYVSEQFTILHFIWAPKMAMPAHNHNLWSVVGVYEGREDHIFWRRDEKKSPHRIRAIGSASIGAGEVLSMDENAIHSVLNPTDLFTGGIHIYTQAA
ncbi:hypothetical protein [Enterovibrio calviensis]|uniref:hypothetical protein n=1 Tax=Enterovibrio calviensis TaxID=91359 RepID=UPI000B2ED5B9|nr:hypothetical protein [Enterovibrio calviensis]